MAPAARSVLWIGGLQPHRRAAVERGLRFGDQLAVEDVVDLVILRLAMVRSAASGRRMRLGEQLGEVEALGLPVLDQLALVEHLHLADHLVEACGKPSAAMISRTSSATKKK